MRLYKMVKDYPYLPKGAIYTFDDESGHVYRCDENLKPFEYPLRNGLAGYLWLLLTDGSKYLRKI